ncbi:glycerophosphodiester phosphodiesterase [Chitinophaga niabensis]|uniref:Glycerophosphoryl diester phosphodiesterase family protein n=1 Tax=Chitinophaga niabensis TaxID=536979 RepID=A0A1N6GRP9_9BACT|nr:glycerophosphodiester phosphodiesterase family protein [Chitinophaga niabensis]SIO10177.1 Glycerophosphoryl diester phosphodiesterase family protein [Chitinophaga niabensis]
MRLRYRLSKSLIMIPALMAAVAVHGQVPSLLLNNYKIPVAKKGALVGQVFNAQGVAQAAKLVEDTSGLFTISKKGEIRLNKKNSVAANTPSFKYAVTVQSGDKRETFILVRDDFHRNKVVAHRGAWKNTGSSQNSLSSLKDAIRIGAEGTEFDVWLSKDGVPVLSHDNHIGDKKIEETLIADLTSIPLNKGDHVPLFEDYILEAMKQNTTHLVLELKPSGLGKARAEELATKCVELIRKHQCEAWMLYISFDYNICKKIVELNPFAKIAYLMGDKTPAELKADKIWGFDYNFKVIDKDISIIKDAKKNGINVNIWTVNNPEQMDTYLKAGVDYLTTDEPEMLLEKVK